MNKRKAAGRGPARSPMGMTAPSERDAPSKRRRRRKEARPGEIIEAGLEVFAERGFAGARLEDVAARAGIVKGTIYRYFENKEALFEAAVRSRALTTLDEVEGLIDAYRGPTRELLGEVIRTVYERLVPSEISTLMRILIAEGDRFPDLRASYYENMVSKAQKLLRRILERGVSRGEFRATPALEVPIVVAAPAIVAALWRITFESHQPIPLDVFLDAHLDVLFNGIAAS